MAKIILSERAKQDLREIARFISLDKPATAKLFIKKIIHAIKRLRQFPKMGRVLPENGFYRELIFRNYRIIYLLTESGIEVVTIFHSARILYL